METRRVRQAGSGIAYPEEFGSNYSRGAGDRTFGAGAKVSRPNGVNQRNLDLLEIQGTNAVTHI
jgi:hypothetical protein